MLKAKNQKGFTLIELLIVIVIIGILAGVLVAIIDPDAQQNRARDAGVQATLNKVALAAQGFNAAYGNYPTGVQLLGSADNSVPNGTCEDTVTSGVRSCNFTVTGNPLPTGLCTNNYVRDDADGDTDCAYQYYAFDGSGFVIAAATHGVANSTFVYNSDNSAIWRCPSAGATQANLLSLVQGTNAGGCTSL